MIEKDNIKCSCGYNTGLSAKGFLKVIRPEGEKCPHCGEYIFPPKPTYPHPKKPYDGPYEPRPEVKPWKIPYSPYFVPKQNRRDYILWC